MTAEIWIPLASILLFLVISCGALIWKLELAHGKFFWRVVCIFAGHRKFRIKDWGGFPFAHWVNKDDSPIFNIEMCSRCRALYWEPTDAVEAMAMIHAKAEVERKKFGELGGRGPGEDPEE